MKSIFVPYIDEVPEWKSCYYDYQTLESLIEICSESNHIIRLLRKELKELQQTPSSNKAIQSIEKSSRIELQLRKILEDSHKRFYEYSQNEIHTIYLFTQLKTFQIKERVEKLKKYSSRIAWQDPDFISLIENLYIEVHYLKRMIEYNRAQESRIVREYELNLFSYEALYGAEPDSRRMDRVQIFVNNMQGELERLYMIKKCQTQSKATKELISFGDTGASMENAEIYRLGMSMGILLCVLAVIIYFKESSDIYLDSNKKYQADFPIWRGASYLVFYQWIMGCCLLFLEASQINYKLVLHLEKETVPKSSEILNGAAVCSVIYLAFFLVYMLQVSGTTHSQFNYWGHLVWAILLIYYLVPLPFTNYQGKLYFLKLLLKVIISPFTRCNPMIIWLSEQIVSFSQPFSDLAYTICKAEDYQSKCTQVPDIALGILITMFCYRLIQNFRMFYQANWRIIPPFYGLFRAFFSLVTVITSYYYRKNLDEPSLIVWLVTVIISTTVAFYVDIKADWGLLSEKILRKNLAFRDSHYVYYILIGVNLLLRLNWTLNISPGLVNNIGILPFYLIMIISYFELVRRGLWNILRIELDHANNCEKFKATVDDSHIEERIRLKLFGVNGQNLEPSQIEAQTQKEHRVKEQSEVVTQNLISNEQMKKHMGVFIQSQRKTLEEIKLRTHIS